MQRTYDPFSYLLGEIHAYDAGQRQWVPRLRQHYLDELLADEAEELAWGRRHLTVTYGPGHNQVSDEALDLLVHGMFANLPSTGWARLGGVTGHQLTITLEGPDADAIIDLMAYTLTCHNPGPWQVVERAVVVAR
jgi:hypothetical protein